jgi:hypothetical protein
MAAILEQKIGYETGGDIVVKLVPPVADYTSCFRVVKRYMDVHGSAHLTPARGRTSAREAPFKKLWSTYPFHFAEWDKAEGAAQITDGEYHNNKALTIYRTTCDFPASTTDIGCAGRRAFQLLNLRSDDKGSNPVISPSAGTFLGPLLVSIEAPKQRIFYTTDGTSPASDMPEMPSPAALRYRGPFYVNEPGPVTIRAVAYSANFFPPNSNVVGEDFTVTEPPGLVISLFSSVCVSLCESFVLYVFFPPYSNVVGEDLLISEPRGLLCELVCVREGVGCQVVREYAGQCGCDEVCVFVSVRV